MVYNSKKIHWLWHVLGFFLIPFFPLQVFIIKLLAVLTNGSEFEKLSNFLTYHEGVHESGYQFALQLYIIFVRADRFPSTTQWIALSSSLFSITKTKLEEAFINKPGVPLMKRAELLPLKLSFVFYWTGSVAVIISTLKILSSSFLLLF